MPVVEPGNHDGSLKSYAKEDFCSDFSDALFTNRISHAFLVMVSPETSKQEMVGVVCRMAVRGTISDNFRIVCSYE
jgi:hypothetical protein